MIRKQHPFWGSLSPLGGLSGIGLLVMASTRLAWAITVAGGLFWVYILSVLASVFLTSGTCKKIFPQSGRAPIFTCISYFWGSAYILLLWLLCPFAAMEVFFPLLLIPLFCTDSSIFSRIVSQESALMTAGNTDLGEAVFDAASEAAVLALLLVFISLIREPLSFCCLSLPGTYKGIMTFISFKGNERFPMQIFAGSAGALLLLGYIIGLYYFFRNTQAPAEGIK